MTTPILEKLSSSNDAPSIFILWTSGGGETQLDKRVLIWLKSHVVEQAKSSALPLANCHTCLEGSPQPSCTNLFLLNQIAQAMPFSVEQTTIWKLVPIIINKRHRMVHLGGIQRQRVQDKTIPSYQQLHQFWQLKTHINKGTPTVMSRSNIIG
ncbi:hypothetical protein ACJW30_05G220800 [Castanea mollissima]